MRKLLVLIAVLICFNVSAAFVAGHVYLPNQNNHSEIKVSLISASPTAVSTHFFTGENGFYHIQVEKGLYNVEYSKVGFNPVRLEKPIIVSDSLFLEAKTLGATVMTEVSGSVSGTWTKDQVYLVVGDINIPKNNQLTIKSGTRVLFKTKYKLTIYGSLRCEGTSKERILFSSAKEFKAKGDWDGIFFDTKKSNTLKGVDFEYGGNEMMKIGTEYQPVNVSISNCSFAHVFGHAIYGRRCNVSISSSTFFDINSSAIKMYDPTSVDVTSCFFNQCGVAVYDYFGKVNVNNNKIVNCKIGVDFRGENTISRNLFIDNGIAVYSYREISAINNTFVNNKSGIKGKCKVVKYNVFDQNLMAIEDSNNETPSIEYNLSSNNTVFYKGEKTGVGTAILENTSGFTTDAFFNIIAPAKLLRSEDVLHPYYGYLTEYSPAINAGKTTDKDANGSIIDLGYKPFVNVVMRDFRLDTARLIKFDQNLTQIQFNWNTAKENPNVNVSYLLHIEDDDGAAIAVDAMEQTVTVVTNSLIKQNMNFKWWVTASNGFNEKLSMDTGFFSVPNLAPGAFSVQYPLEGEKITYSEKIKFNWLQSLDDDNVWYCLNIKGDNLDTTICPINSREFEFDYSFLPNAFYSVIVTATDGIDSTSSERVSFEIVNGPPSKFNLIYPSNNDSLFQVKEIGFKWDKSDDFDRINYTLNVFGDGIDTTIHNLANTEYTFTNTLELGKKYNWRVAANDGKDSTWTDVNMFHNLSVLPEPFEIKLPIDNSTILNYDEVRFVWNKSVVSDFVQYKLTIYQGNNWRISFSSIKDTSYVLEKWLSPGLDYTCRVEAYNSLNSIFSKIIKFRTPLINSIEKVEQRISIYPNPASEFITIDLNEIPNGKYIAITNLTGRMVNQFELSGAANLKISVNNYIPGIYFLMIYDTKRGIIMKEKIIVN